MFLRYAVAESRSFCSVLMNIVREEYGTWKHCSNTNRQSQFTGLQENVINIQYMQVLSITNRKSGHAYSILYYNFVINLCHFSIICYFQILE